MTVETMRKIERVGVWCSVGFMILLVVVTVLQVIFGKGR